MTKSGSLHSFELDRWSKPDENHRVKHIGMADAKETFDKLKTHLETHGLLPDEYFLYSDGINFFNDWGKLRWRKKLIEEYEKLRHSFVQVWPG